MGLLERSILEAAAVAAAGSLLVGVFQYRLVRRVEGHKVLLDFLARWDAPENRVRRMIAARELQRDPDHVSWGRVLEILNFFENLGTITRAKTLHKKSVWSVFSSFAEGYWFACEVQIEAQQKLDRSFYRDFAYLMKVFEKIERKARDITEEQLQWSDKDKKGFLANESELDVLRTTVAPAHAPKGVLGFLCAYLGRGGS
jgi:hypothetical protein